MDGDVWFNDNISALAVEDRSNPYAWEVWDAAANLAPNWTPRTSRATCSRPCKVWRNRYTVVVDARPETRTPGTSEDAWNNVINPGSLPVGWRPQFDLWDVKQGTEEPTRPGRLFEIRVTNTGNIQVQMKGLTLYWQDETVIPIHFQYPRAS